MPRDNEPLTLDNPHYTFLAHFWRCLFDDLRMKGCPSPYHSSSRQSYREHVKMERERLREEAYEFLGTEDFRAWASASGFNPDELKESFNAIRV